MQRVASAPEGAMIGAAGAPREREVLPRSDELLARLVASGGERPFRALYERYHARLYRYCYSIVRNEADAQDAVQSTFTRALVALRQGRRNAPLRPWLYSIAHNESISMLRSRRPAVPESEREPVALGQSVEERADDRARLELLLDDLAQLSQRARAALVMRELSGLSHEQIAGALEISEGAAKQAIFEARSALFELAEGRAMACDDVRRRLSDGDRRVLRGRQIGAHLRDCAACSAFAAAIPARQAQLRALCPALPPAAAAAVLVRALEGAEAHGGRAAVGISAASSGSTIAGTGGIGAGVSSTVASATKVLVAIVTPKVLLTTAVIAGAAAGAGALETPSPARDAGVVKHHAMPTLRRASSAPASYGGGAHESRAPSRPGSRPMSMRASQNHPSGAAARRGLPTAGPPPPVHGRDNGPRHRATGNSANASSRSGTAPGNSANASSRSGTAPGNSANASSRSGAAPGNSGAASSRSGTAPGNSANASSRSGTAPGNSGAAGKGGDATGRSRNSPGSSRRATSRTGTSPGQARHQQAQPGSAKSLGNGHWR